MVKNLLGRLKNRDIDSVHEFVEYFIAAGIVLDFTEGIKERYEKARKAFKFLYNNNSRNYQ